MAKNPNRTIVDTSKLTENMKVASYSQMCSLIGCDFVCCGSARMNQINNWKRYFDFTISGHAYIINKIYNSPLPSKKEIKQQERQSAIDEEKAKKLQWHEECRLRREQQTKEKKRRHEERNKQKIIEEQEKEKKRIAREERKVAKVNKIDGRTNRAGKYISGIEILLLDYLKHSDEHKLQMTTRYMFQFLGFVNSNYMSLKKSKETTKKTIEILKKEMYNNNPELFISETSIELTPKILSNFFQQTALKAHQVIRMSLQSMEKRALICCSTNRVLVDNSKSTNYDEEIIANDIDEMRIKEAENTILKELGYDNIGRVYATGKVIEYYSKVKKHLEDNKGLSEDELEWYGEWKHDWFYSRLSISLNDNYAEKRLLPTTQNNTLSYNELRDQINSHIIEYIISKAQKKYTDFEKECKQITLCSENKSDSSYFNEYPTNYVEIISFLADYFLNIHYKGKEKSDSLDLYKSKWEEVNF